MQGGERFNSIGDYLKSEFGRKTVKLSIDAGFTCPNRDGTSGYGGCAFCSEGGSGELASHVTSSVDYSASITEQIDRLSEKWPDACYLAYFQSFTNTYAPVDVLRSRYFAALDDPRISGIAIATRPDCLGNDVLDLLEEINRDHFMWVELGLQSVHNETLKAMNTCYTYEDYEKAAEYYQKGYSLKERRVYKVIKGFPRLVQKDLPMGISNIRYKLSLQNCEDYISDVETIVETIKEYEYGES